MIFYKVHVQVHIVVCIRCRRFCS